MIKRLWFYVELEPALIINKQRHHSQKDKGRDTSFPFHSATHTKRSNGSLKGGGNFGEKKKKAQ